NDRVGSNFIDGGIQADVQFFSGRRTDLQGQLITELGGSTAEQHVICAVAGIFYDVVEFSAQGNEFRIQSFDISLAIGTVGGLGGQVLHAQNDIGELVQR